MMKKKMLLITLCLAALFSVGAAPGIAGDYDGLWINTDDGLYSLIRSVGQAMLVVSFDLDDDAPMIWLGNIIGNTATLQTVNQDPQLTVSGTFNSSTKFTGNVIDCSWSCPEGEATTIIPLTKIF